MKPLFTLCMIIVSLSLKGQLCDPNSNSFYFDGTSSYIGFSTNNDLDITDEITIEAWIKASSWGVNSASGSIVCKHGWTTGEEGYVLRAGGNGELSFNISGKKPNGTSAGWKEVVSAPGSLQLNTWHHVAGTYDGSKLRIYIDGVFAGSTNFNGSIDPSSNYKLKIGKISDNGAANGRYWHGYIDEVRIWERALSQSDIDNNKSEHINPQTASDLVGYWRLNDVSNTTVNDRGDGNNDGTLHDVIRTNDVPFTNGIARPEITDNNGTLTSNSIFGNQWNLNSVPISGATGITYTPTTGGIYSLTVNYGFGCFATSLPFELIFTGMNENKTESVISYSIVNKVLSMITIPENFRNGKMNLYDLKGSSILENCNVLEPVNLITFPSGMYLLSIYSDGASYKTKIVLY